MIFSAIIITIVSIILMINLIFDIKFSCKCRGFDSVDNEEMYTNKQESSEEEESEEETQEEETQKEETPEEETQAETQACECNNCTCDKKILDCSRSCSCNNLNNEIYDDMPPLVSTNTTEQVNTNNLREQIIN